MDFKKLIALQHAIAALVEQQEKIARLCTSTHMLHIYTSEDFIEAFKESGVTKFTSRRYKSGEYLVSFIYEDITVVAILTEEEYNVFVNRANA